MNARATSTQASRSNYMPSEKREGIALCLSGGGFRAVLYHLGALTRLNELGILSQVDTVSCVSGGSIVGAVLADRLRPWPMSGASIPATEWHDLVVEPLVSFTGRDLRTGPILRRLRPSNWFRPSAGVLGLADHYCRDLTRLNVVDLPDRPRFVFSSTDLVFGVDFLFERGRMGSYQSGFYVDVPKDWTVARAVAASSCFPPIFNPLRVGLPASGYRGGMRNSGRDQSRGSKVAGIELSDGGVYDNLGLEPVWKDCQTLLVSDGGAPFSVTTDRGFVWRLKRYADIASEAAGALRKRWLVSGYIAGTFEGAYWGINSAAAHYRAGAPGYSEDLVRRRIANIRTDLDVFSSAEGAVLQNHGYALADAAVDVHLSHIPKIGAPFSLPFADWVDAHRIDTALDGSDRRSILGRESILKLPGKFVRG
jgi:NTE family protein